MINNIRFDSIKIPKVKRTKEGYLRGEVVVSRAGVFKYRNQDGSIRGELRHPNDVFKHESLETLKMIPITNNHPPVFVDAENAHQYQVGYTGERYDVSEDKIIVSITVTHKDAINAILNNKQELSLGYFVDLIEEKGTYNDENYEYRQSSPLYNHLAIVEKGRAGSEARFRFDNALESIEVNPKEQNKIMKEESQLRIDALNAEKELLNVQLNQLQAKLDHIEKAWENTRKELNSEKVLKADDLIEQRVVDRVALFSHAGPYLKDIDGYLRHTDREIMVAVMNSVRTDSIDYSGQSDEFIKGMFYNFVGVNNRKNSGRNNVFETVAKRYNDSAHNLSIHDQLMKKTQEDWIKNTQGAK